MNHYITDMADLPRGSEHTGKVATSYPPQDIYMSPNGDQYYVMRPRPEPIVHDPDYATGDEREPKEGVSKGHLDEELASIAERLNALEESMRRVSGAVEQPPSYGQPGGCRGPGLLHQYGPAKGPGKYW